MNGTFSAESEGFVRNNVGYIKELVWVEKEYGAQLVLSKCEGEFVKMADGSTRLNSMLSWCTCTANSCLKVKTTI